jgi:hypothetical protein
MVVVVGLPEKVFEFDTSEEKLPQGTVLLEETLVNLDLY